MGIKDIFGGRKNDKADEASLDKTSQRASTQAPPEEKPATNKTEQSQGQEKPSVPKKITCRRCKGDGTWHSSCSGARAITSFGPDLDAKRKCPKCKGTKIETILITYAQAMMEVRVDKARKGAEQAASKARAAAEHAERVAKEAEAKLK